MDDKRLRCEITVFSIAKSILAEQRTLGRAIACFDLALADVGLTSDGVLRRVLHDYFAWATTTAMSRYHRSANDLPSGTDRDAL